MLRLHKEAIEKSRRTLVMKIRESGAICDLLEQKGVFIHKMVECIERQSTQEAKNEKLVDYILRVGPDKYSLFLDSLRESGYGRLADVIGNNENILTSSSSVPTDEDMWPIDDIIDSPEEEEENRTGTAMPDERDVREEAPTMDSEYSKQSRKYKMETYPRGRVLIINNAIFDPPHIKNRDGADIDKNTLLEMFNHLGFEVTLRENLNREHMLSEMGDFVSNENLGSVDSIAIAILSHGNDTSVCSTDGGFVTHVYITDLLNPENCPLMANKPKLIIFNSCRGPNDDPGYLVSNNRSVQNRLTGSSERENLDPAPFSQVPNEHRISKFQDYIIAYSTYPGHVSYRFPEQGSIFITFLKKVFLEEAHRCDVITLLTEVNRQVLEYCRNIPGLSLQMPEPRTSLLLPWYLNPPSRAP